MLTASIRINNDVTAGRFNRLAALCEELGFDQLWVSHDLFWRSAPVLLAGAFAATSRIRLGAGVMNPVTVHPAELAMHAATLQEVSGDRFLLGIGAGADTFLSWVGMAPEPPVQRVRRAVTAVRALLAGGRPELPGWGPEARLRTGPAPTPIFVGGMGPRMLRLAGELADGALPLLFPPEHFTRASEQIGEGARRAGRDPAQLDVAACIWCSIGDSAAGARQALADKLAYYGASFSPHLLARVGLSPADFAPIQRALAAGAPERARDLVTPAMLSLGVAGGAEDVIERCRWLVAAGASHLSFGPPLGPEPERAIRIIAGEVLPAVRAADVVG